LKPGAFQALRVNCILNLYPAPPGECMVFIVVVVPGLALRLFVSVTLTVSPAGM
jgi:hypothetical protein